MTPTINRLFNSQDLCILHDSVRENFIAWDEFISLPDDALRQMLPDTAGACAEIMRLGCKGNTEEKDFPDAAKSA
jgi:hypothetical protein